MLGEVLKVGSIVRNIHPVRVNPVRNPAHAHKPIKPGYIGIVIDVKQTELNASYSINGKGDVYVDVMLSVNGESVRCGNFHAGTFKAVI
jgi:hypothetical protein